MLKCKGGSGISSASGAIFLRPCLKETDSSKCSWRQATCNGWRHIEASVLSMLAWTGLFFCDLDHWPQSPGPDYGPMMPCLLTHGCILELSRARFVTPSERFLSLGFHAVKHASDRFFWNLGPYVLGQADRYTKSQSGNSQSLPIILAWNLYTCQD